MSHSHSHSHSHHNLQGRNLFISILLNILITVAQVIGGIISGSLALLSDALHNFSDVISLIISYVAHKLGNKKASLHKTFGYKRAEILAAFINASTLIIVAVLLIIEAVKRFQNPEEIASDLVIWLSFLGILANGITSISAILSTFVTRDIISSLLIAGIAADSLLSTFIEIVPPVNIAATFLLFIIIPTFLFILTKYIIYD